CGDVKVPFRILSFDIETGMNGQLYSVGLHQLAHDASETERSLVLMNGAISGEADESLPVEWLKDERQVLIRMIEVIREWDPDIIAGWHVIGFDFKFLEKKAVNLGIPLNIGR